MVKTIKKSMKLRKELAFTKEAPEELEVVRKITIMFDLDFFEISPK